MGNRSSTGLMTAGAIVTFIGLCIILIRVMRVPAYWVPLMVGVGLFLVGFIRRLTHKN